MYLVEIQFEIKSQVPLTATTSSGQSENFLLEGTSQDLRIPTTDKDTWVKLNNKFIGYYRVQYSPEYLQTFVKDIESKAMTELDRLSVLDDTMALVQAGKVSTDVALRLISSFVNEDSYVVWRYENSNSLS